MEATCALVDSFVVCTRDKHLYFLFSGISVYYQWAVRAILGKLKPEMLWRPHVLFLLRPHTLPHAHSHPHDYSEPPCSNSVSILKHLCSWNEWKVLFLVKRPVSWWKGLGSEMLQWVAVPPGLLGCCWGLAGYVQAQPESHFPLQPVVDVWSGLPARPSAQPQHLLGRYSGSSAHLHTSFSLLI